MISFLPIVERELRQLSRRKMTYRSRTLTGFTAALIGFGSIGISMGTGGTAVQLGRHLFLGVTGLTFCFALLAGLILVADCLSEEKRQGTLGLLLLTELSGGDVVAGKLAALAMPAIHCLLAVFPVLGMCFFLGGVTGAEFAHAAVALSGALFFSLTTAMLASALCFEGVRALGLTALLMLAVIVGLPAAGHWLTGASWATPSVFGFFSPLQGIQLSDETSYRAQPELFWGTMGLILVWSCLCLIIAGECLPHRWQDQAGQRERRRAAAAARPLTGKELEYRRRILGQNPMLWLGSRNRGKNRAVWLLLAGVAALLAFTGHNLTFKLTGAVELFVVIYLLHACLKVWMAWEASRRFAEDRDNGALELLLCTPMAEDLIWRGWGAHLRNRFLAPVVFLAVVDLLVLNAGIGAGLWWGGEATWGISFLAGIRLFITDMYTLGWVGLWNGLTARNSTRACMRTITQILLLPAAGCLGLSGLVTVLLGVTQIPLGELTTLWFASGYIVDALATGWAVTRLNEDFRASSTFGLGPGQARGIGNNPGLPTADAGTATCGGAVPAVNRRVRD